METVAIAGLGLIGGSFALGLRQAGFTGCIIGVDDPPYAAIARERGIIDSTAELREAAGMADLIYLARPVDQIMADIAAIAHNIRPGALVTDCGSTKRAIQQQASEHLPAGQFLGGHPMAGKEKRGIQSAEASLFRGKTYVLCPPPIGKVKVPGGHSMVEHRFRDLLVGMGCLPVEMSADDHDRAVAYTSHLPQLVATALAATLNRQDPDLLLSVFGPGLVDMMRLAGSASDLWRSILVTNADQIEQALRDFQSMLGELQQQLTMQTQDSIFQEGQAFAGLMQRTIYKFSS